MKKSFKIPIYNQHITIATQNPAYRPRQTTAGTDITNLVGLNKGGVVLAQGALQ